MEDASAVDLDWFWRGWFYTIDHVDIAMDDVKWFRVDTKNPDTDFVAKRKEREKAPNILLPLETKKSLHKPKMKRIVRSETSTRAMIH